MFLNSIKLFYFYQVLFFASRFKLSQMIFCTSDLLKTWYSSKTLRTHSQLQLQQNLSKKIFSQKSLNSLKSTAQNSFTMLSLSIITLTSFQTNVITSLLLLRLQKRAKNTKKKTFSFIRYHFGDFSSLFPTPYWFFTNRKNEKKQEIPSHSNDNYMRFMLITLRYPFSRSFNPQIWNFRESFALLRFFHNFLVLKYGGTNWRACCFGRVQTLTSTTLRSVSGERMNGFLMYRKLLQSFRTFCIRQISAL
jgi:hypothetical protein